MYDIITQGTHKVVATYSNEEDAKWQIQANPIKFAKCSTVYNPNK